VLFARGIARAGTGKLLLIGLSRGNVERLLGGQPIRIRREVHGKAVPEDWEIVLFFGETEQAMADDLRAVGAIQLDTEIFIDPKLTH